MAIKLTYTDGQESQYGDDTKWEVDEGVLKLGKEEGKWSVLLSPSHWAVIEVGGSKDSSGKSKGKKDDDSNEKDDSDEEDDSKKDDDEDSDEKDDSGSKKDDSKKDDDKKDDEDAAKKDSEDEKDSD